MPDEVVGQAPAGPQIVISLGPNGALNLQGPLDQPLLMYGMLEMAKITLQHHLQQKSKDQQIMPVSLVSSGAFPFKR